MVVDDDGRVSPREVELGFFFDAAFPGLVEGETQWAVIERGLTPGERVVVSNLDDLAAGTPVSPVPAGAGGAAAP
jgi:multidrug efflux pump subunit AcrA (membrane-fusion protein)